MYNVVSSNLTKFPGEGEEEITYLVLVGTGGWCVTDHRYIITVVTYMSRCANFTVSKVVLGALTPERK
jgi:hypothetical protein